VALTVGASIARFPVPLFSTTTMPIIPLEVALGSSVMGAGSSCYYARVCWLVVPLDPVRSTVA
jgi:hypothetical protein